MRLQSSDFLVAGIENKFLYNGKEYEDDLGLNWYHYGARFYDPQLGRWHAVDPLDEFHSPYLGIGNNPIILFDPDGRGVDVIDPGTGEVVYTYGNGVGGYDDFIPGDWFSYKGHEDKLYLIPTATAERYVNVSVVEPEIIELITEDGDHHFWVVPPASDAIDGNPILGEELILGVAAFGKQAGKFTLQRLGRSSIQPYNFFSGGRLAWEAAEAAEGEVITRTVLGRIAMRVEKGLPQEVQDLMWRKLNQNWARGVRTETKLWQDFGLIM